MNRDVAVGTTVLAERIGATLEGPNRVVRRLLAPGATAADAIVVAGDAEALAAALAAPDAGRLAALLVPLDLEVHEPHPPLLRHADPRLALARISAALDVEPLPPPGIDPGASVAAGASVAEDAHVGPAAVIASGAVVGSGCIVGAGAVVGEGCRLGEGTRLFPRVVLYPGVHIGRFVRVHAGAVIGADGFGYAAGPAGAEKLHHLGGVVIGDHVEIGANTCIDRGTLGDTEIGEGTKIDNLCQIGHNVRIGRHCLIAGLTGIAGSSTIGDGVLMGGGVAITDHVRIGAGVRLAGRAGVTKDVPAGEAWGGAPAVPLRDWARERYLVSRLDRIWSFVRRAEKSTS